MSYLVVLYLASFAIRGKVGGCCDSHASGGKKKEKVKGTPLLAPYWTAEGWGACPSGAPNQTSQLPFYFFFHLLSKCSARWEHYGIVLLFHHVILLNSRFCWFLYAAFYFSRFPCFFPYTTVLLWSAKFLHASGLSVFQNIKGIKDNFFSFSFSFPLVVPLWPVDKILHFPLFMCYIKVQVCNVQFIKNHGI